LVSSSFLRHYDETKTLLCSIPLICLIGADGEHMHHLLGLIQIDHFVSRHLLRRLIPRAIKVNIAFAVNKQS
jgi:hypothetical protein